MSKYFLHLVLVFVQFSSFAQKTELLHFEAKIVNDCNQLTKPSPKPQLTALNFKGDTVVLKAQLVANCGLNGKQGALQFSGDSLVLMWTENNQVIDKPQVIYENGTWFNKDSSIKITNAECNCLTELTYVIVDFKEVNKFYVRDHKLQLKDSMEFLMQKQDGLTIAQWTEIQLQVNHLVKQLKDSLESIDVSINEKHELTLMFALDTLKIERTLALSLEVNYTTAGVVNAIGYAHVQYEKLLNKYYSILLAKLDKEDREVLRKAQREWLKFRDYEQELIYLLSQDKYSGVGTIQNVLVSDSIYEVTRSRTIQLYQYLSGLTF